MKYCEVGNHEIAQDEDDHRCDHCNRPICKAHMGNPDGLPGDLVACVDHVAEVKRKEAQLRLSRLRNQQEPTPAHDGKLEAMGKSPYVAQVEFFDVHPPTALLVLSGGYGASVQSAVYFDPKQALSLLAWLEQERATLEQLAIEQKEG